MELLIKDAFVVHNYGTRFENVFIKGINLTIHDKDIVTVIGDNNGGKSALLQIIAGKIIPTFGKIIVNCDEPFDYAQQVSYISSDCADTCYAGLSVIENLVLAMLDTTMCGLFKTAVTNDRIDILNKYIDMYDFFDIQDVLYASLNEITDLQKRVLALLIAMIKKDKLLVVDNITRGLSKDVSVRLLATLKSIVQNNDMTLVSVMNDPRTEFEFFNRCIILNDGKITLDVYGDAKKQLNFENILEHFNLTHSW